MKPIKVEQQYLTRKTKMDLTQYPNYKVGSRNKLSNYELIIKKETYQ